MNHLEANAAAMAEDVIEKAAIIKSHVMGDSPGEPSFLTIAVGSDLLLHKVADIYIFSWTESSSVEF